MAVDVASKFLDGPFSHVINGKLVDTKRAKMLVVLDPATEQVLAQVPIATRETLDEAFKAMTPELVKLLTAEKGKWIMFAQHECESILPWFTELSKVRLDQHVLHQDESNKAVERYLPLGVCAGITPRNLPVLLMLSKALQALVTGNCIIIKPSPFTPLCDICIIEAAQKVFPPGVVQTVVGDDSLPSWVTEHARIQKISFTGSTVTGRLFEKSCSALPPSSASPSSLEAQQSDMATAAQNVLLSAFFNSGQVCISAKRIYVHEDIYDEFKQNLAQVLQNFKLGPGNKQGVMFGPINNSMQYNKVAEFFQESKRKNFNFVSGGETGYFYPFSIVDNSPEDSKLVQEEPFDPIVPLLKWKDEADLIKRVNDSQWGLAATVWGSDHAAVERIARQIESGTVWTNRLVCHHPAVPFGGMKSSGIGAEHGKAGLSAYCQAQALWLSKENTPDAGMYSPCA
ncbi:probable Indole-3-acetaldehyde dehydrogenase [Ustilago bromivora]|nr:probable Indole-3-acetaldehyde dehydrogenase [Ustilago bromivora]